MSILRLIGPYIIAAFVAFGLAVWFSIIVWTFLDIRSRSRGKLVWIEVLVDDAYAGGFLQVLAAGDPDVAVLPPSPTTPTQAGVVR